MALAWKAGKVQAFVGSNPTLSARWHEGHSADLLAQTKGGQTELAGHGSIDPGVGVRDYVVVVHGGRRVTLQRPNFDGHIAVLGGAQNLGAGGGVDLQTPGELNFVADLRA